MFSITKEMETVFEQYYCNTPDSLQDVLMRLKELGASQMQSLRLLVERLNIGLREADMLVLHSNAWSEEKEANIQFRDDFLQLVKEEQNYDGEIPL